MFSLLRKKRSINLWVITPYNYDNKEIVRSTNDIALSNCVKISDNRISNRYKFVNSFEVVSIANQKNFVFMMMGVISARFEAVYCNTIKIFYTFFIWHFLFRLKFYEVKWGFIKSSLAGSETCEERDCYKLRDVWVFNT